VNLRYYLILIFFLLALTPLLLFRAWPHSELLEQEFAEVEERHLLLARTLAASLEHYHEDLDGVFTMFATRRAAWDELDAVSDILRPLGILHVCGVSLDTGVVTQRFEPSATPCPDRFPDAALSELLDRLRLLPDGTAFGPARAGQDGASVMDLARRGGHDELVVASINTDFFRELGGSVSFGIRGHAAIVDHAGNVLSHPLAEWERDRKNILGIPVIQSMLAGGTGIGLFHSPALNADMIAGYAHVDGPGWGVMVPQPLEEIEAKAASARASGFYVMIIGVLLSLFAAVLISLYAVRPFEDLTSMARNVAHGDYGFPKRPKLPALQPLEVRQMYASFHEMVVRLRKNQGRINKLAFFDIVTGLTNRECFRRRVQAFVDSRDAADEAALLFVDLDGFKAVNDTLGHDVGDHVLGQVAVRLTSVVGAEGLTPLDPVLKDFQSAACVSRLGGDEFAIFLPKRTNSDAVSLAEDIRRSFVAPFVYEAHRLSLGASIGIACLPQDAEDFTGLLKAADIAMYDAKRTGKNRACVFGASRLIRRERRDGMAEDLFSADIADQIAMFYQPVYDARDMSVAGVEGLIRWQHPKYGVLGPEAFFELVTQLGLKRQIDRLAFSRSMEAMVQIERSGLRPPNLSLNVPVERLLDDEFVADVVSRAPFPFRLSFEICEAAFSDVTIDQAHWAIDRLREAGVKFELDDFGSAEASITSMLDLAPHRIKLDTRLVRGVALNPGMATLTGSLVRLAHDLEIEVVAKGIETLRQLEALQALDVDYLQGFVLNPPLTTDDLMSHLGSQKVGTVA
jgi:diguanylate cyclase (GGDEF)-like protein